MRLRVTLDTGEVVEFEVDFAHMRKGTIAYRRTEDQYMGSFELSTVRLVEFEAVQA